MATPSSLPGGMRSFFVEAGVIMDYNSVFPSPQHRCQRPNVHAALLPSLEESLGERLVFRPESSNLMYGMYKSLFE
jgi:hypothetical protein